MGIFQVLGHMGDCFCLVVPNISLFFFFNVQVYMH